MPRGFKKGETFVELTEADLWPIYKYCDKEDIFVSEFCRRTKIPQKAFYSAIARARYFPIIRMKKTDWDRIQAQIGR